MGIPSNWVPCDGCGLPASPAHVAERLRRLELAARYRPIHIGILFVAAAPLIRPEDDFYGPPESRDFFNRLLGAVEIPASGSTTAPGEDLREKDAARLVEFQHRGYYLSYLSECPLPTDDQAVPAAISRLGPALLRRIRFNYRPRQIAVLGRPLRPLGDIFEKAAMPSTLLSLLEVPDEGDPAGAERFRKAIASLAPGDNPASEYDRIRGKQT
jgi:hypothetical protein